MNDVLDSLDDVSSGEINKTDEKVLADESYLSSNGIDSPPAKKRRKRRKKLFTYDHSDSDGILMKWWNRRYDLFWRFDEGIKIDKESWYSVTPEVIARRQAEVCTSTLIVDACCGIGGNSIQFTLQLLQNNARVYGCQNKIDPILGDVSKCLRSLKKGAPDIIFMSPPWGGPGYSNLQMPPGSGSWNKNRWRKYALLQRVATDEPIENVLGLESISMLDSAVMSARHVCNRVGVYLPRNSSVGQLLKLGWPVENKNNCAKESKVCVNKGEEQKISHDASPKDDERGSGDSTETAKVQQEGVIGENLGNNSPMYKKESNDENMCSEVLQESSVAKVQTSSDEPLKCMENESEIDTSLLVKETIEPDVSDNRKVEAPNGSGKKCENFESQSMEENSIKIEPESTVLKSTNEPDLSHTNCNKIAIENTASVELKENVEHTLTCAPQTQDACSTESKGKELDDCQKESAKNDESERSELEHNINAEFVDFGVSDGILLPVTIEDYWLRGRRIALCAYIGSFHELDSPQIS